MIKSLFLNQVTDSLAIGPKYQAGVRNDCSIPSYPSKMYTIEQIKHDSQNPFYTVVINFKGKTVGEFLEYLNKNTGMPYVTNETILDVIGNLPS